MYIALLTQMGKIFPMYEEIWKCGTDGTVPPLWSSDPSEKKWKSEILIASSVPIRIRKKNENRDLFFFFVS